MNTMESATIFLVAYVFAEALIGSGFQYDALNVMHSLSGVAGYDVPPQRKNELSIHLLTQTLAIPGYVHLNHKAIVHATQLRGPITYKEAAASISVAAMMIWLTYIPLHHTPSQSSNKFRIIHFLVEKSNFAYALAIAICVYVITIGLQVAVTKVFRGARPKQVNKLTRRSEPSRKMIDSQHQNQRQKIRHKK